ncbi:MAG: hypothetical protein J6B81_01995 [Spirochaetaceae bacterium]|nr:hypothetical protein [Spirochaetaceae bacterium]
MKKLPFLCKKIILILITCIYLATVLVASEPTVELESYTQENIPSWAEDLRRAEIITFGSLPFVTLGVTMGYSFYRYFSNGMDSAYFPNPLAKTSEGANLSTDEQVGIILSSVVISSLIGITDFTINLVQRNKEKKKAAELDKGTVIIQPLSDSQPESEE